jgi:class 3 adenylate cyclase
VVVETPRTRYAKTVDGVNIAYQVRGGGPVDLVYAMGWTGNLEVELEGPRSGAYFGGLASFSRLILFDKRGTGLSDRDQTPDLEMRADDLRAVMDAVGSERAVVLGDADGGALAAFFAATHPERVQALVLAAAYARVAWAPDYSFGTKEEAYLEDRTDTAERWGSLELARAWVEAEVPSLAHDVEFIEWWAKAMRYGASPGAAVAFLDAWYAIDVRAVLGSVQAPTLVLSVPGYGTDQLASGVPTQYSEDLAQRIPGAKYVTLPGRDFAIEYVNPRPLLDAIEQFVRSVSADEAEFDRVLATILFTDIVGSTEKAAELGDVAWRDLLDRHQQLVRAMIGRYRGNEINTSGDGFLATFDGPARGVRCAQAIANASAALGLEIRAGLHTGEIAITDADIHGIAVHIGARVGALAAPSEVLVSQTVKDLVAGSGLKFEDAGEHELKGVPDRWHLYRAAPSTPES